jgi:hypothetical protein
MPLSLYQHAISALYLKATEALNKAVSAVCRVDLRRQ